MESHTFPNICGDPTCMTCTQPQEAQRRLRMSLIIYHVSQFGCAGRFEDMLGALPDPGGFPRGPVPHTLKDGHVWPSTERERDASGKLM